MIILAEECERGVSIRQVLKVRLILGPKTRSSKLQVTNNYSQSIVYRQRQDWTEVIV